MTENLQLLDPGEALLDIQCVMMVAGKDAEDPRVIISDEFGDRRAVIGINSHLLAIAILSQFVSPGRSAWELQGQTIIK